MEIITTSISLYVYTFLPRSSCCAPLTAVLLIAAVSDFVQRSTQIYRRTEKKKKVRTGLIVILIWMRKHLNKRAIGGREVKGFTFNKRCTKTTLNLKRCALKGMYKALCKCLLMSACMCVFSSCKCVCMCPCHTHTHTQGWFIPSTGQVNWSRPFRLVFSSRSNESSVSRLSKQCAPVS